MASIKKLVSPKKYEQLDTDHLHDVELSQEDKEEEEEREQQQQQQQQPSHSHSSSASLSSVSISSTSSSSLIPSSISESPPLSEPPNLSILKLILLSLPFIGIQFCWAIQSGYSTSTFLQLGMPDTVVSYAWLAGPVSGIIVQPIVGEYSDKLRSRFGRRRPFVVVGAILVVLCLIVFGNSGIIGNNNKQGLGLAMAVASFWLHDMAINAIQGPARSLLPDNAPGSQLYLGNALIALMTGLGSLAGNYLGSVKLTSVFTFSSSQIQILYGIGAIVVIVTVSIGVVSTKEIIPLNSPTDESDRLVQPKSHNIKEDKIPLRETEIEEGEQRKNKNWIRRNCNPVIQVFTFLLQFPKMFTWFGWFCLYIYGSVWVASDVYHGVADSGIQEEQDKFDAGIRTANLGLALQSVVAIVAAPIVPFVIRVVGLKWVYLAGQIVFSLCLFSPLLVSSPAQAVAMLAVLGIPWACTTTIPWSLTILSLDASQLARTGLLMATMNLSICFPQIVVSFIGSGLLIAWGSYAGVLATGGIMSALGAIVIIVFVKN